MVNRGKWILVIVLAGIFTLKYYQLLRFKNQYTPGITIKISTRVMTSPVYTTGKPAVKVEGIWVQIPEGKTVSIGDKIEAIGSLEMRLIDKNEVWFVSQYQSFYIERHSQTGYGSLVKLNHNIGGMIRRWLPGDEGALTAGIILGGNQGFTKTGLENFRKVNLTHIIAASGYNVTVICKWAMAGAMVWLSRRKAILFGIVCTTLYVMLAGATAAVVRAGVMGVITFSAGYLGKKADAGWLLILTVLVMLAVKPGLIEDIGFQLSVAATGGLVMMGGNHQAGINITPFDSPSSTSPLHPSPILGEGNFRDVLARVNQVLVADLKTTLVAQAATWPLILHYFGNFNWISPVVNAAVLWTVPLAMEVGAIAVVLGLVIPFLGQVVMLTAWPLLKYTTWVVAEAGRIPWTAVEGGAIGWGWVAIYYLTFIIAHLTFKNKIKS